MEIESVTHRALRRLIETGATRGVPEATGVRRMVAFLIAAETAADLLVPPNFGAHQLVGDRSGTWSLIVTRNWRMTFKVDAAGAITDLNLEDYH